MIWSFKLTDGTLTCLRENVMYNEQKFPIVQEHVRALKQNLEYE